MVLGAKSRGDSSGNGGKPEAKKRGRNPTPPKKKPVPRPATRFTLSRSNARAPLVVPATKKSKVQPPADIPSKSIEEMVAEGVRKALEQKSEPVPSFTQEMLTATVRNVLKDEFSSVLESFKTEISTLMSQKNKGAQPSPSDSGNSSPLLCQTRKPLAQQDDEETQEYEGETQVPDWRVNTQPLSSSMLSRRLPTIPFVSIDWSSRLAEQAKKDADRLDEVKKTPIMHEQAKEDGDRLAVDEDGDRLDGVNQFRAKRERLIRELVSSGMSNEELADKTTTSLERLIKRLEKKRLVKNLEKVGVSLGNAEEVESQDIQFCLEECQQTFGKKTIRRLKMANDKAKLREDVDTSDRSLSFSQDPMFVNAAAMAELNALVTKGSQSNLDDVAPVKERPRKLRFVGVDSQEESSGASSPSSPEKKEPESQEPESQEPESQEPESQQTQHVPSNSFRRRRIVSNDSSSDEDDVKVVEAVSSAKAQTASASSTKAQTVSASSTKAQTVSVTKAQEESDSDQEAKTWALINSLRRK